MLLALILAGPTRPPKNFKILWIRKRAAKLSWEAIPCPHRNGRILRHIVRHDYELPNGTFALQRSETSWRNSSYITLRYLRPNSNYAVQVAGVTDAGVGPFSVPLLLVTPGGIAQQAHTSTYV